MCLARDGEKRKRERGVLKRMYVQAIRVLARFRDTLTFFLFNCCFFFFFYFFLFSDYFLRFFFIFLVLCAERADLVCVQFIYIFFVCTRISIFQMFMHNAHTNILNSVVFLIFYTCFALRPFSSYFHYYLLIFFATVD